MEVRDNLIANQEALLNVYRCQFNIDTQVVPGGCTNGKPTLPPVAPVPFGARPTAQDITARDTLVQAQESLLNVYRCQFNIDTQIVPGGCPSQGEPEPDPNPKQTEGVGAWELVREDSQYVDLRLSASSTENYSGNTPYMYVSCVEEEDMAIYFRFPGHRLNGAVAYWLNGVREAASGWVTDRWDNDQAVRYSASIYRSRLSSSENQNWMRDTLFAMIENPGTFTIQVDDGSDITPRATFTLAGLRQAVQPVREACEFPSEPTPDPLPNGWQLVQRDAEWVDLRLFASSTENYLGNSPYMYVSCNQSENIAIYFWFPDERLEGAIAYRLNGIEKSAAEWVTDRGNNDQAVRYSASTYRSRLSSSENQNWMRDTLFAMIENPGTFTLQANDGDDAPPTATFNLAGLPEAVKPVREACGI